MAERAVVVRAPSRLHFGMFSFGVPTQRQFGGAGVMIDGRRTVLRICDADEFECRGPHESRLRQTLEAVRRTDWGRDLTPCRVELVESPPSHVGLGSGTQTALATVAGLRAWSRLPPLGAGELATTAGRAKRSAVGLHGFLHGGLIVEAGRMPHDAVAPLAAQVALPSEWRFVLIRPIGKAGISGDVERAAFADLPPVPRELTDELCRIALLDLVPAARTGEFAGFADAVYRFGHAAGECFKSRQAGVYATDELAAIVARVRAEGVAGVGQSSWGPTLFTLHPTRSAAEAHAARWRRWPGGDRLDFTVVAPAGEGAVLSDDGSLPDDLPSDAG
mgnify:CR=1 FL=1